MKLIATISCTVVLVLSGCSVNAPQSAVQPNQEWGQAAIESQDIINTVESAVVGMREIFSQRVVSIVDYGAVASQDYKNDGDLEHKAVERAMAIANTKAIYAAICDVSSTGGGTVVVPYEGGDVFYTAAIHLEDNISLSLDEGAVLKFTTDTDLYCGELMAELYGESLTYTRFEGVELMNYSPFIYAYEKKNIAISGYGTIDGQASFQYWHSWKMGSSAQSQNNSRSKLMAQAEKGIPVSERIYGEAKSTDDGYLRPNFIQPYKCQNVLIEEITILNSPMWEIHPVLCQNVMVDRVVVDSHLSNNDGCNPESTSNMVIQNCRFDVGDDCIAIKSGRNADGRRIDTPTENIVIRNNIFMDGHGGITIGSEVSGGVNNIYSHSNIMESEHLQSAYRFKSNYIRGGDISNIFYQSDTVRMVEFNRPVVLVDLNYDIKKEVEMMKTFDVEFEPVYPTFSNVYIDNLMCNADGIENCGKYAFKLNGVEEDSESGIEVGYINNFNISNSVLIGADQAFNLRHVDGLYLKNVRISGGNTPDELVDIKNIRFEDCDFTGSKINEAAFGGDLE